MSVPIHPEAAAHADAEPPPAGERYTAAQLYARLLREPPEAAMELLRLLAGAAQAGGDCLAMDHEGAMLTNRRLTRELQERAEREAAYRLAYDDYQLTLTHMPCGQLVATTQTMGIATHGHPVTELSEATALVELSAAVASHRCPVEPVVSLSDTRAVLVEPCPECKAGKCPNCDGTSWDQRNDRRAPCPCATAEHGS